MSIDMADDNAVAERIVPHAKSSSCTVVCIIDRVQLLFIVLGSIETNSMASACHLACQ
jgi:hypothetical protein